MNRMKQTVWKKTPYVRERFSNFRKKHMLPIKPAFPIKDTRARDPYFWAMERRVEEFVQEEHDYEEMMKDVYERRIPPPPPDSLCWTDQQIHVACIQLKHPFL